MEYLYKLKMQLSIKLKELPKPTEIYNENGELKQDSLTTDFWQYQEQKEKLEFAIKSIDDFITDEIDGIEKLQYDMFYE